jgi:hypothetical protein
VTGLVFGLGFSGVCQRVLSIGHEVAARHFFISIIGFFFASELTRRFIQIHYSFHKKHHIKDEKDCFSIDDCPDGHDCDQCTAATPAW